MNIHETIIDSFGNRDFQAAFRTIDIEERNEYLQEYLSGQTSATLYSVLCLSQIGNETQTNCPSIP